MVVGQCSIGDDDSAPAQQTQCLGDVLDVLQPVTVDEDHVVGVVAQLGQHVQWGAGDEAHPVGADSCQGEDLAGGSLTLGIGIDAGQHAFVGHALQQGQG